MNRIKRKAKDVVRGDRISLDLGYGPREHYSFCTVLEEGRVLSQLFPDPKTADHLSFYVDDGTERFYTISFSPEYEFDTIPKRKKAGGAK